MKGSNAEPLSTKFTREDVGRIERHVNEAGDFNTVNGYSPIQPSKKKIVGQRNVDQSVTKSATTLPKLSNQVKQQVQEANKLEFPMARFLFKDIEFPDENHYRRVKDNLKKEYEEQQNREKYPPS